MHAQGAVQNTLICLLRLQQALVHQLIGNGGGAHAPRQRGQAAVGLHIDKVAPAANGLTNEQPVTAHIRIVPKGLVAHFAVYRYGDHRCDHTAVDGQAAVPDGNGPPPVKGAVCTAKLRQIENHIVSSGPDDGQRHSEKQHINEFFTVHAQAGSLFRTVKHRQQKSKGDNDAIPIDVLTKQVQRHPVEGKFQAQAGKRHRIDHDQSHLS